jgi:hypothetical protein
MLLWCPLCHARHVDKGEYATKSHHTHSCQTCGLTWRPAVVPTVGVDFLPGFKDVEPAVADACAAPVKSAPGEGGAWWFRLDGIEIMRHDAAAGWVVFSGSDGEAPSFRAFFPGCSGQALAERLVQIEVVDGDEFCPLIFDPAIVPALLVSGLDVDGGLYHANHHDDAKGIAAMARAWGRDPAEWQASPAEETE